MALEQISKEVQDAIDEELLYEALKDEFNEENILKNNKKLKKRNNSKKLKIRLRQDINIKTVCILLVVLIMNTYAWFIYISTVDSSYEMHVRDWDILIKDAEGKEDFEIEARDIYPGFNLDGKDDEASKAISIKNAGDINSDLTLSLIYVRILDNVYATEESKLNTGDKDAYTINYMSSSDILKLVSTPSKDCPFRVKIKYGYDDGTGTGTISYSDFNSSTVLKTGTTCYVYATIDWPYSDIEDSNKWANTIDMQDEWDTYFGNLAKKFNDDHLNTYAVVVKVEIKNTESYPGNTTNTTTP